MTLYKYRSLDNFKNFIDIILNERIYAAPYFDMNDPMEGHYFYNEGNIDRDMIDAIKGEKTKIKICSFSRTSKSSLMWSHYSDGHKGVVIGVEVDPSHRVNKVKYGSLSEVRNVYEQDSHETAKKILTRKLEPWRYEEEERIFVTNSKKFAKVKIKEIVLGSRITTENKSLIKKLIPRINPSIVISESDIQKIV